MFRCVGFIDWQKSSSPPNRFAPALFDPDPLRPRPHSRKTRFAPPGSPALVAPDTVRHSVGPGSKEPTGVGPTGLGGKGSGVKWVRVEQGWGEEGAARTGSVANRVWDEAGGPNRVWGEQNLYRIGLHRLHSLHSNYPGHCDVIYWIPVH